MSSYLLGCFAYLHIHHSPVSASQELEFYMWTTMLS